MARRRQTFSRIGGHHALDLANTQPMGEHGPVEKLLSFSELLQWFIEADLVTGKVAVALRNETDEQQRRALRSVRALREGLRAALKSPRQAGPADKLRSLVNAALAVQQGSLQLTARQGSLDLIFSPSSCSASLLPALAAHQIARLLISGDFDLAKPCAGHDCVLWFADRTRNGSRNWCRMETCGARSKARAYYQRNKARAE